MRTLLCFLLLLTGARAQTPVASPAKPSPFSVDVAVGTSQRRMGNSSYRKTMDINPKVTIVGINRTAPLPAAEATLLILTMDTRAKYVGKFEEYRVHDSETLPLPAAASGAPRPLAFTAAEVVFDSYRDNSNIGGEVYKYYVLGLRDPESGQVVNFETNHLQLAAYIKAHPEKRDDFLKIAKGAKFPAQFNK